MVSSSIVDASSPYCKRFYLTNVGYGVAPLNCHNYSIAAQLNIISSDFDYCNKLLVVRISNNFAKNWPTLLVKTKKSSD